MDYTLNFTLDSKHNTTGSAGPACAVVGRHGTGIAAGLCKLKLTAPPGKENS